MQSSRAATLRAIFSCCALLCMNGYSDDKAKPAADNQPPLQELFLIVSNGESFKKTMTAEIRSLVNTAISDVVEAKIGFANKTGQAIKLVGLDQPGGVSLISTDGYSLKFREGIKELVVSANEKVEGMFVFDGDAFKVTKFSVFGCAGDVPAGVASTKRRQPQPSTEQKLWRD